MSAELDLADLTDLATVAYDLLTVIGFHELTPSTRVLAEAGFAVFDRTHRDNAKEQTLRRLAYVLMLDALLGSPEAIGTALGRLRRNLMEGDPALALFGGHIAAVEAEACDAHTA